MLASPQHPLLIPSLCFAGGILSALLGVPGWCVALPFIAALMLFLLKRIVLASVAVIAAVGYLYASLWMSPTDITNLHSDTLYSGTVTRLTEGEASMSLDVQIDSAGVHDSLVAITPTLIHLTVIGHNSSITPSSRIRWSSALTPLSTASTEDATEILSEPMRHRGVVATGFVRTSEVLATEEPGLVNDLRRLQRRLSLAIISTDLSPRTTTLLNAILLGDTSLITDSRRTLYSSAGLSHLLALSGMHVAIIALVISIALSPLMLLKRRRLVTTVILAALWVYALMTGMMPSVVRAVVMATAYSLAYILQRQPSPTNSLCLAAIVILLLDPFAILSYGFILSFAAVASIICFASKLNPFSNTRHHRLHSICAVLALPLAAMLGTGFIAAFFFHIFPVWFIIPAVAASILLPIIMIGGLIATLVHSCWGVSLTLIDSITDGSVHLLESVAHLTATLPGATIEEIYLSGWTLGAALLSVAALAMFLHTRRVPYATATLLLAAITFCTHRLTRPNYDAEAAHLSVLPDGQNTVILLRHHSRAMIITDAQPVDTMFVKERVKNLYRSYLALTHSAEPQILPPNSLITIGGKRVAIAPCTTTDSLDYLIIPRRFHLSEASSLPTTGAFVIARGLPRRSVQGLKSLYPSTTFCSSLTITVHDTSREE